MKIKQLFPAMILSGGLATRLRPMTEILPKSMIVINEEPFVAHQLRLLRSKGIQKVILCVGYLSDAIIQFIGDGNKFGLDVRYSHDGDQLLGTGGAVKKALSLLQPHEDFFLIYGDSYLNCDYPQVQETFHVSKKLGLMTVFENNNTWDKSNIEFLNGEIKRYDKNNKTDKMHYIDYGLGVFNQEAFKLVPDKQAYDIAILYQDLLAQKQLAAYEVYDRFFEVGSVMGIKELSNFLAQK